MACLLVGFEDELVKYSKLISNLEIPRNLKTDPKYAEIIGLTIFYQLSHAQICCLTLDLYPYRMEFTSSLYFTRGVDNHRIVL